MCSVINRRGVPVFAMADIEENAGRKAAGKKEIVLSRIERITRFGALVWMQWGIVLDKVSGLAWISTARNLPNSVAANRFI